MTTDYRALVAQLRRATEENQDEGGIYVMLWPGVAQGILTRLERLEAVAEAAEVYRRARERTPHSTSRERTAQAKLDNRLNALEAT